MSSAPSVSTQSEVVLLQGEAGSAPIMLYVTMENIKVSSALGLLPLCSHLLPAVLCGVSFLSWGTDSGVSV